MPSKKLRRFFLAGAILLVCFFFWNTKRGGQDAIHKFPLDKGQIAQALGTALDRGEFPEEISITKGWKQYKGKVSYTLDLALQNKMERLIKSYKPDYGAFIALDAETGRVLSLVSYTNRAKDFGNVNLKATFPAASVFKIVTSAAAMERANFRPDSVIPINGSNHTLYKRNLMSKQVNRWTRTMTMKEAFSKSVNVFFGKLGIFFVKPSELEEYAKRFLFNQKVTADFPVQNGSFSLVDTENDYKLAEAASGFNHIALMSPVQGALIAASIVNGGVMMEPYIVESVISAERGPLYFAEQRMLSNPIQSDSARGIRELMAETVKSGTSRVSFRDYLRKTVNLDIEVGGKTGSLTGTNPKGKYDWFVGYASLGERKIAVAALSINEETWKVKSSLVARTCIETYFKPPKKVATAKAAD